MKEIQKEYERLLDSQNFVVEELDYSILDRHIETLTYMARMSNSGVTIFDMYRRKHVFASYNFPELFSYDMDRIRNEDVDYFTLQTHPDDIKSLTRNGVTSFRFFLEAKENKRDHKLISEYRINLGGKYTRVIEQIQGLEYDSRGNSWLSLCVLDVSPNQAPLNRVESKIQNFKTGEVFSLPDYPETAYREGKIELTPREKAVLKLVRDGLLSKEISGELAISVNTVNTYRQRIIEKLDANNSQEAIRYAEKLGLID